MAEQCETTFNSQHKGFKQKQTEDRSTNTKLHQPFEIPTSISENQENTLSISENDYDLIMPDKLITEY